MKTLYILGNGFDIAHGLKTRYSDFYNYLSENKDTQTFLYNMIDAYGAYDDEWWNTFEESLGDGSWFEMEFENMAESVIDNMVTDDGDEMPDIESTLETHWEAYYKFMEKLNNYVLKWISDSIDLSDVKTKVRKLKKSDDYFINFNYTMVLEEIYKISAWNVFHVHGSVAERNAIMGHGNLEAIRRYKERTDNAMATVVMKYIFKRIALKEPQFKPLSPHTLRHTFATRCIERGMNPKTLQIILGHSTIQITMNLYCHVTDDMLISEMSKFEAGANNNNQSIGVKVV